MRFNDTFVIRGPIRCDSGLRRRSGSFPCPEGVPRCSNTIPSAFQLSPSKEKLLLLHRIVRRCTCTRARHGHPGAQSHGSMAFPFSGSGYSTMPGILLTYEEYSGPHHPPALRAAVPMLFVTRLAV